MTTLNKLITDLKAVAKGTDRAADRANTPGAEASRRRGAEQLRICALAFEEKPPATFAQLCEDIALGNAWLTAGTKYLTGLNKADMDLVHESRAARRSA